MWQCCFSYRMALLKLFVSGCCLLPLQNAVCQLQLPSSNQQQMSLLVELQEPDPTLTFASTDVYPFDVEDFHTDASVLRVAGTSTTGKSNLVLQVSATKVGSRADANAVLFGPKNRPIESVSLAGLPGTRLEITDLAADSSPLRFFDREWRPKSSGRSFIIVTQKKVIAVNAEAILFRKRPTSSSRIITTAELNDRIAHSTNKPQSDHVSATPPTVGAVTQEGQVEDWYNRGLKLMNGQGSDEEKIEAYRCFHIAAERGFAKALTARYELGNSMRPVQVLEAKQRAAFSEFKTRD